MVRKIPTIVDPPCFLTAVIVSQFMVIFNGKDFGDLEEMDMIQ